MTTDTLTLYELINPSDPYTFYAPTIEVAGVVACLLSPSFGAKSDDESTPILFGWNEWLQDRGIDGEWIENHKPEIASAFESFLIGSKESRTEIEEELADAVNDEARAQLRNERQDRKRTSMNAIGELAYELGAKYR